MMKESSFIEDIVNNFDEEGYRNSEISFRLNFLLDYQELTDGKTGRNLLFYKTRVNLNKIVKELSIPLRREQTFDMDDRYLSCTHEDE